MATKKAPPPPTSPSELRARLDRAIREGKFQTALDLAKQLVRSEPTPENHARLVESYLGRGNQLADQVSSRDAAICLDVGLQHAREPALLVRFAEAFARAGEAKRAVQILERVPEPRPANRVMAFSADAAMKRGAVGRDLLPEHMKAEFDRIVSGFTQLHAGQDEAVRESLQAIGLSSPFLEWKVLLRGLLAYYQNDDQRAIENWSRLDPNRLPARIAAPLRLPIDQAFATAQSPAMQEHVRRQSDRLQGDGVLNGLRNLQSELVSAQCELAAAFREAESLLPLLRQRDAMMVQQLARIMYWEIIEQGQPHDIARFERLFGQPADDPKFIRMSALALERQSFFFEAHRYWQDYEKSLKELTSLTAAEQTRARALIWFRMGENARQHESVGVELPMRPFDIEFEPQRRINPSSEVCFKRAWGLAPDWIQPQVELVTTLFEAGKFPNAIKAGEDLLNRFPDHLPTLEMLTQLFVDDREFDKAADMLERALGVTPLNRMLRTQLLVVRRRSALNLAGQGRFEEARQTFKKAYEFAGDEPHPLLSASWAALEFKAGNVERAEELLQSAVNSPTNIVSIDGWMVANAAYLKLPKKIKDRFEKPLKELLDATNPTPEQVIGLLNLYAVLEHERTDYVGSKTHRKKAIALAEKAFSQPYPESVVQRIGQLLVTLSSSKTLRKLAAKWARDFPKSPWPAYFTMESYLMGDEDRWQLWRVQPLAEQAKRLAESIPPNPQREALLNSIERRLEQFRDFDPLAGVLRGMADDESFEDDPW